MRKLSIAALTDAFPNFRVAALFGEGLAIRPERSPEAAREIEETEARCRQRYAGMELSTIPAVAAWRGAYRAFGIKKTSYRSSVERLIKRVLAGDALPPVNALVDSYNAASVEHGLCLGCDDLDKISGDLEFRFARDGESFVDMSAGEGEDPNDPPKPGEVVYADERHVLCRRWNWRQDARTLVTPQTRRIVLTLQSNGFGDVEAAAWRLAETLIRECGGAYQIVKADSANPVAEI
jgi:DNA/RNA-binding domain of Phe-tRNA-synthetase-like protein